MPETLLDITGGLPYNRRVRIINGAVTWPTIDDFEVRSEIRVSSDKGAKLKGTLTQHITPDIEGDDIVLDLNMTGSETRELPNGFYDVIVSDAGSMDNRAIRVIYGRVQITPLVTGG